MNIDGFSNVVEIKGGASGIVYQAERDGCKYAIKICTGCDAESLKRFDREYRIAQTIRHPNIIEVFNYVNSATSPYFVMELCDGTLETFVGAFTEEQKLDCALQVCEGIKALHDNNILHRDIKPSNVLLKNNVVKVTDFSFGFFCNHKSKTLTSPNQIVGTEGYIAPEVLQDGGHAATRLSDIYSLGCTLFVIFSGGTPIYYYDNTLISPSIARIIDKCRSNDPLGRYQSVAEVIDELKALSVLPKYLNIDELNQHRGELSAAEYRKHAFLMLMSEDSWPNMIDIIIKIGPRGRKDIIQNEPNAEQSLLLQLELVYNRDNVSWKQFEDIDPYTDFCSEIFNGAGATLMHKQKVLELTLDFAVGANRWNAERVIMKSMLSRLSPMEVRDIAWFLHSKKSVLEDLSRSIGKPLPTTIQRLFNE